MLEKKERRTSCPADQPNVYCSLPHQEQRKAPNNPSLFGIESTYAKEHHESYHLNG